MLERRELVGGCAVTEEIWPGYRVSTGAYLTSLLQERIVRELELERYGYQVDAKDPAFFSAFPDGRHFFMWQDRAKTLAEIAKFSQHDAEVYPAYEDQLERISQVVEELLLTTPPQFPPARHRRFRRLPASWPARCAASARKRHRGAGQDLHAERGGVSGRVVRIRAGQGDARHRRRDRRQRRSALAGHGLHPAASLHGRRGRTSRVVGIRARRHGRGVGSDRGVGARHGRGDPHQRAGRARCWCAAGARAASCWRAARRSRRRSSPRNLDPKLTFLRLLDERDLPAGFRRRPSASSASKAPAARSIWRSTACPSSRAYPGAPGPQHRATMHICPSIEYVERAWDDAKYGRPSRAPAARADHPDDVRSVARAAGQAHHGDLPAVRALHAARRHVGRTARAVRRPRDLD